MDPYDIAAELRALAERLDHLPAHDRRRPEAFTEGKSELAADLLALADRLTARQPAPPAPRRAPRRPHRPLVVFFGAHTA